MLGQTITYSAALGAGLLSFFSPCVLPLIPAYFTFITGYSLDELTGDEHRKIRTRVIVSTVAFVLGFSTIFILMGATASALGKAIYQYQDALRIGGGILVIIFGLHVSGIFRLRFLEVDKRVHLNKKPVHVLGTFLVGMAFGTGWSPCVGPLLGSILALAAGTDTVYKGILLLMVYSAGLALPFLVLSMFIHLILAFVRRANRFLKYVNAVAGVLLIVVGVLLITDLLRITVQWAG